jgi:hypothetical protein
MAHLDGSGPSIAIGKSGAYSFARASTSSGLSR